MPTSLHTSTDALRHVLVTLADRLEHAVGDAPSGFAAFEAGQGARTPLALVRHVRRLMRFATALWTGAELDEAPPLDWASELAGWRQDLLVLDATLRAQPTPSGSVGAHQVLQGPLLDAATHIGQLTLLRRLAGAPVDQRSYWTVAMAELDATVAPER